MRRASWREECLAFVVSDSRRTRASARLSKRERGRRVFFFLFPSRFRCPPSQCFSLKTPTSFAPTSSEALLHLPRREPAFLPRRFCLLDATLCPTAFQERQTERERGRRFLSLSLSFRPSAPSTFFPSKSISRSSFFHFFRLTFFLSFPFASSIKQFKIEPFKHPVTMDPSYGGEFLF